MSVKVLIELIDEAYDRRSWHGTNLRGSLRKVEPRQAVWRPGPERHSIWELLVHAAYWKYAVRRRLLGDRRGSFPLDGSNWFPRPARFDAGAWREDLRLLASEHASLREAVAALNDADLERRVGPQPVTVGWLVRGAAAHDLYHAGQIQLLKKLAR